uniref:Ig-like domain-containing protein n=1 Tax=Oryzias sinensis TaxID=183150 RepID=A0A8C7WRZ2_9TELE
MNSLSQLSPFSFTEKVTDVLKGSSVVLSPGDAETSIISIAWKHGAPFIAVWFGGNPTFFFKCNDGCSLNNKTGELTINDVKIEDSGEYTPEINGKILSAVKLQVLSPVPKPRITHDCNPEKTKCTLTCRFDRTDDLGDVEVFWILDDRREKGTELQITKDTKEKTFICSLKNPVSSENSTELKNPLFSGGTSLYYLLILLVIALIGVGVFLIFHFKIFRGRNKQRTSAAEEQKGLNDEISIVVWKQNEINGVTENTRKEGQNNGPSIIITPPGG